MRLGPTWRALIGLTAAALIWAAAPAAASADPVITRAPTLYGSAVVGSRLDAVGATWSGRPTISVNWRWLRCDTDSYWGCRLIDRAQSASYIVSSSDLGKRLRAVLWISNRDGSAYVLSSPTAAVTRTAATPSAPLPAPVPLPVPVPVPPTTTPEVVPAPPAVVPAPQVVTATPKLMKPAPLVRIRGWLTRRGARITLLTVRAPRAAKISVSCSGIGCPRVAPAQVADLTRLRAYEGMLRAGARLVIRVTMPGYVGKHTLIRIRRGKQPIRVDRCLYPGTKGPTECG